jgi:uncharacterized protein YecE (DUF72 family)
MNVRVGTCGWSYDDWVGPFYPPGTAAGDYLQVYARHFDVVEVDSSFYRTPSRRMSEKWSAVTPNDFRFTLKLPRTITHDKALADCDDELEEFVAACEPLGEKLRCALVQLGYFNRKTFATPGDFYKRLDAFLARSADRLPLAVETRNRNYLRPEFFELLARHNVSFAAADHVWMPPVSQIIAEHDVLTGPLVYLRLIGDRKGIEEITTTWDKVVLDRGDVIASIVESLRRVMPRAELAAFINNHFAGHAPTVARAFLRELGEQDKADRAEPDSGGLFE